MNTEVSVNVASLLQPFVLKEVSIGLNGDRPDMQSWLEEMDTSAPYSEEAFEWKIARLLPCPRSFFTLLYENESKDGNLRIIFGARSASLEAAAIEPKEGYCEVCYAQMTDEYKREKYWPYTDKWNHYCMMCYDTGAYEKLDYDEMKLKHLIAYEREYIDRLEQLYVELANGEGVCKLRCRA